MTSFTILYFLQGEVGESLDTPNAFIIPKNGQDLNFGTFLKHFPLSKYNNSNIKMFFRFQVEDSLYGYVWQDISNVNEKIPIIKDSENTIIVKVLKIDINNYNNDLNKRQYLLRRKQIEDNNITVKTVNIDNNIKNLSLNSNSKPKSSTGSLSKNNNNKNNNNNNSNINNNTNHNNNNNNKSEELLEEFHEEEFQSFQQYEENDDDDFFDDSNNNNNNNSKPVVDMMDFGNDNNTQPIAFNNNNNNNNTIKLSREELVAKRESEMKEKVKDALEFKREMDDKAVQDGKDFDAAKEKYEAKLLTWAVNNKEKRNVRTLLSTMHTVLWADSKWKAIGLGDVIEPKQIKLQYRKAMLVVHPDRCSNMDNETKFIAKRIFEAINEAYEEFLKKEGL